MSIPTYLIYHKNCPDGFAASWIYLYHHKMKGYSTNHIILVPAIAGNAPTDLQWNGKHVIILDISFRKQDLLNIASKALSVMILDHHQTAQTDLSGDFPSNVSLVFDMNKCGAQLAWDMWFEKDKYPWYIKVIADRDLWAWKNPYSKPLGEYLSGKGYFSSYEKFEELVSWNTDEIGHAVSIGSAILETEDREIESYVSSAVICDFKVPGKTYKVYLTGCPHKYASEVGSRLSNKSECDFAVMWRYSFIDDEWNLSCRSSKLRPDIDLSIICSKFGGGGHKSAAGFTIDNSKANLNSFFEFI